MIEQNSGRHNERKKKKKSKLGHKWINCVKMNGKRIYGRKSVNYDVNRFD